MFRPKGKRGVCRFFSRVKDEKSARATLAVCIKVRYGSRSISGHWDCQEEAYLDVR